MRLPTVVVRGDVLTSWLTVSDYTRTKLAHDLGVSKGRISQLLTSREEPSAHLIAKLLLLTRLPFDRLFKLVRADSAIPATPEPSTAKATIDDVPQEPTRAGKARRDLIASS